MGSAKHMRNNGEEIRIHQHDNYQMAGTFKNMGDTNQNQPMKGYNHMQPGKISGGAAQYITQSMGAPKPDPDSSKSSKPTDAEKAAYMKENANAPSPDFDVNSPLPEGSSDIGGEMVGKGRATIVTGNFNRKKDQALIKSNFPKFNVNSSINSDSGMAQQGSGQRRTDLVESMVNSSPSDAQNQLDQYQASQSNRTYKGVGSDMPGAPETVGEFYSNNPSTRGDEYLGEDLKVTGYQPKPKFKPSGAPNFYAKKKN